MADDPLGVDIGSTFGGGASIDLDPYFASVSGALCVAQSTARKLTSPRGSIWYAPGVGRDIRGMLNDKIDQRTLRVASAAIVSEVRTDDRIDPDTVDVRLTFDSVAKTLTVAVSAKTITGSSFSLVLAVSALTVTLLEINAT